MILDFAWKGIIILLNQYLEEYTGDGSSGNVKMRLKASSAWPPYSTGSLVA